MHQIKRYDLIGFHSYCDAFELLIVTPDRRTCVENTSLKHKYIYYVVTYRQCVFFFLLYLLLVFTPQYSHNFLFSSTFCSPISLFHYDFTHRLLIIAYRARQRHTDGGDFTTASGTKLLRGPWIGFKMVRRQSLLDTNLPQEIQETIDSEGSDGMPTKKKKNVHQIEKCYIIYVCKDVGFT